jgi:hypothetical protein
LFSSAGDRDTRSAGVMAALSLLDWLSSCTAVNAGSVSETILSQFSLMVFLAASPWNRTRELSCR